MNLPKTFNIRNQVSAYDEAYMKDWTQVNAIMYENLRGEALICEECYAKENRITPLLNPR